MDIAIYQCYFKLNKRYTNRNNQPDTFDWGYITYQGGINEYALTIYSISETSFTSEPYFPF